MSSIRSILERLALTEGFFSKEDAIRDADQALKDISELIDGAKPKRFRGSAMTTAETNNYGAGFNHSIETYQSNLKELLK